MRTSLISLNLVRLHLAATLPGVARELDVWRRAADSIPSQPLRRLAIASLTHKRFHCEGGSVFATWLLKAGGRERAHAVLRFIVAFQTISDYLDNLCDRTESLSAEDFRCLHQSMFQAITPEEDGHEAYYRNHPESDDGGYLEALVDACRDALRALPRYDRVQGDVRRLLSLYVDLQVHKHIRRDERVAALVNWFDEHRSGHESLTWWEFAAASGSTLAIFALVSEAGRERPVESHVELLKTYFPWVCGLHILLDYFIDQAEDRREGDLNFVSFYPDQGEVERRLNWILLEAIQGSRRLVDRPFHLAVIDGLLGLYLSDAKVKAQGLGRISSALLRTAGWRARLIYAYCRRWRRKGSERVDAQRVAHSEGMTS